MTDVPIRYARNTADPSAVLAHLQRCSTRFVPPLQPRVDLARYARKIVNNSCTFEAWAGTSLCGLVAAYLNDVDGRCGFVTSVSVDSPAAGRGVAATLLCNCVAAAREKRFEQVSLEVSVDNTPALRLYRKMGFVQTGRTDDQVVMRLELK